MPVKQKLQRALKYPYTFDTEAFMLSGVGHLPNFEGGLSAKLWVQHLSMIGMGHSQISGVDHMKNIGWAICNNLGVFGNLKFGALLKLVPWRSSKLDHLITLPTNGNFKFVAVLSLFHWGEGSRDLDDITRLTNHNFKFGAGFLMVYRGRSCDLDAVITLSTNQ